MKIVFLSDWFSEKMGYAENCLPKAMAALGHDVHVITTNAQVYFSAPDYQNVYEPFLGPPIVDCGAKAIEGFHLHRLPIINSRRGIRMKGLKQMLKNLRPDIVQTFDVLGPSTREAIACRARLKFKVFTANHVVASVFPLYHKYGRFTIKEKVWHWYPNYVRGKRLSAKIEKCFPATSDAKIIATRFWGVPENKAIVDPLGVDTFAFKPIETQQDIESRKRLRQELGIDESEILCIYTGRFTTGKNPLCLAKAIARVRASGSKYRGLFIGSGPQEQDIRKCAGCIVRPFVPYPQLPDYFRAADIGIWPQQESTSMLDAAASGIPIIISDKVLAIERVDGNGLQYSEGDSESLSTPCSSCRIAKKGHAWAKMAPKR